MKCKSFMFLRASFSRVNEVVSPIKMLFAVSNMAMALPVRCSILGG